MEKIYLMSTYPSWNWQQNEWPNFIYHTDKYADYEKTFIENLGFLKGLSVSITDQEQLELSVDHLSHESVETSEIEGEFLNHDSLQASLRKHFGLDTDARKIPPAERGIAEMMVNLYRTFASPLQHETLWSWHKSLMMGRTDLAVVGGYRTHDDPMQIVSGPIHAPKIHFEAPASSDVKTEMDRFITWFNDTGPNGVHPLPALIRASIAHLYFVCIHPFEDGNGRIARAIAEKALSQNVGRPTMIALSHVINKARNDYYQALSAHNRDLQIEGWISYFSKTILSGQNYGLRRIKFVVHKGKFYAAFSTQMNERQKKIIERLFRAGPDGFEGGLSHKNYVALTGVSDATATRDLQDLVLKAMLRVTGVLKGTRYYLNLD